MPTRIRIFRWKYWDLRSLLPLDYDAIRAAVSQTGKVLVLHEDTLTGGVGAEVAAWIGEHCFFIPGRACLKMRLAGYAGAF